MNEMTDSEKLDLILKEIEEFKTIVKDISEQVGPAISKMKSNPLLKTFMG